MHILDAYKLAAELQSGHKDAIGRPYIELASRVFLRVVQLGGDRDQQIAALLHDVMKGSDDRKANLLEAGVPPRALTLIETLSQQNETYIDYINRVRTVPGAILVKLCELDASIEPQRISKLDSLAAQRLQRRYEMTKAALN